MLAIDCRIRVYFSTSNNHLQVKEQIEFLTNLDERRENPELLLMLSHLNSSESVELLDKAVSVLQSRSSQIKFGVEHLIKLDPELLIRIALAYPQNVSRSVLTIKFTTSSLPYLSAPEAHAT